LKINWVKKYLIYSTVLLLIVGLANFLLDPLQQYRKASFYKPYYTNSRFLNPGLIKSYDYDSFVLGSSMAQNFILSDISHSLNFKKPIKLTSSGARANLLALNMRAALQQKNIKKILLTLDFYAFSGNRDSFLQLDEVTPYYLYDNNYFNDYLYLLNIDTLKAFIKTYIMQILKKDMVEFDYNKMYQWQHRFNEDDFNSAKVIAKWSNPETKFNREFQSDDFSLENLKRNFRDSMMDIIESNPDVEFYILLPPYSVLAYVDAVNNKTFNNILKFQEYISLNLLKYKNVKLFAFNSEEKIIVDLENYRDAFHPHQNINKWMVSKMSKGKYLVDRSNYMEYVSRLEEIVSNYINKNIAGEKHL